MADLPPENCAVRADLLAHEDVRFSAWLVAKEALEDNPSGSGPIPPPEERILDALELLAPVDLRGPVPSTRPNVALAASGAKANTSSVWSPDYTPDKAIDGNFETRWNSAAGDAAGAWLAVEFPAPRTISMVSFFEAAGGRITGYKLQSWDGSTWSDLLAATKPAARTHTHGCFNPVTTPRIRLLVTAATAVPTIYELEVR